MSGDTSSQRAPITCAMRPNEPFVSCIHISEFLPVNDVTPPLFNLGKVEINAKEGRSRF